MYIERLAVMDYLGISESISFPVHKSTNDFATSDRKKANKCEDCAFVAPAKFCLSKNKGFLIYIEKSYVAAINTKGNL